VTTEPVIVPPKPGELLPCPFCGSEAGLEHDATGRLASWRVYCRDATSHQCPVGMTNTIGYARRVEAATAWNRRVS
jgi:Restriction alleviation protein Lar